MRARAWASAFLAAATLILPAPVARAQETRPAPAPKPKAVKPPPKLVKRTPVTPGQRAAYRAELLEKILNLSAEQKTRVSAVILRELSDVATLIGDPANTPDQRIAKLAGVMKMSHDGVAAILTPEQKVVWEALRELAGQEVMDRAVERLVREKAAASRPPKPLAGETRRDTDVRQAPKPGKTGAPPAVKP